MQGGETLSSIAANLWGDSSLWYKLAEANGLCTSATLSAGQQITVPSGVMKNTHSAQTFKPYDPSAALGDTSPTTPKPPKNAKCGMMGAIILVAIAVAVTALTAGAAIAALAPASAGITGISSALTAMGTIAGTGLSTGTMMAIGAAAGAAGSIVSQGVGVATGLQDKFSWKVVAMAGISGGISGGLGSANLFQGMSNLARGAVTGALSSATSQGIGYVTGWQDKFDWVGVAAAGVGGGAGSWIGGKLPASLGDFGRQTFSSMSGGIANAATRSLVGGTSFGDNILAALPDIIGSTIGNACRPMLLT